MTIKILLVDDHTLLRSGVKLLLQRNPEFEIVGEAADGLEGVKRAKQLRPDVILMDLHMPGLSGLEAMQLILLDLPATAVLMLTVSEQAEDLGAALQAGARGYLLKNIESDKLMQAIRRAAAGQAVVAESMMSKLVDQVRGAGAAPAASAAPASAPASISMPALAVRLTPREREAMTFLARGQSNKEIARELDVAESTVKIHVQNILKKLHLSSRVQIAVYAVEHGIVK